MQEAIAYLNRQISQLSHSLGKCQDNTTTLMRVIHDERERVEDLKRQLRRAIFVQFLEMVSKLGTGGDSWVCSDTTPSWSYGYVSERPPHPNIKVQSWTAYLDDRSHRRWPLVFPPPPSANLNLSESAYPDLEEPILPGSTVTPEQEQVTTDELPDPEATRNDDDVSGQIDNSSVRVVGYIIRSLNPNGGNGWWRITKLPEFGVKGKPIEFWALAGKWAGNRARYEVTVYYIEGDDDVLTLI